MPTQPEMHACRNRPFGRVEHVACFNFTPTRKYTVELETWTENGETMSDCRITYRQPFSGRTLTTSLACAMDTHRLESADCNHTHDMQAAHVDEISDWAVAHGY